MSDYAEKMSRSFETELQKIATAKVAGSMLLPAAVGGGLTLMALKANKDRRLGRRLRMQSRG